MKSKGFTLIELLAVIVVLAIVSLIATPIILNVIETANKESAELSALGYVDGVEKQIIFNDLKDLKDVLDDGVYILPITGLKIKGKQPDSGWLIIENSEVVNYSFEINGYISTKGQPTVKGNQLAVKKLREVNMFAPGELVYFDPVSENLCNESSFNIDNVIAGTSTCYKWRVIETNDLASNDSIKLQLDHNLINTSQWISSTDYADDTNYGENGKTDKGPLTIIRTLNEQTSTWSRVPALNYSYDTTIKNYGLFQCINGTCNIGEATLNNVKARIITVEELSKITNREVTNQNAISKTWSLDSTQGYYYSNKEYLIGTLDAGIGNTRLSWIVENIYRYSPAGATKNTYGENNNGYWTMSPASNTYENAWLVNLSGSIIGDKVSNNSKYGIRPVIEISKSLLR